MAKSGHGPDLEKTLNQFFGTKTDCTDVKNGYPQSRHHMPSNERSPTDLSINNEPTRDIDHVTRDDNISDHVSSNHVTSTRGTSNRGTSVWTDSEHLGSDRVGFELFGEPMSQTSYDSRADLLGRMNERFGDRHDVLFNDDKNFAMDIHDCHDDGPEAKVRRSEFTDPNDLAVFENPVTSNHSNQHGIHNNQHTMHDIMITRTLYLTSSTWMPHHIS